LESDWPTIDEILAFRDRVIARLRGVYDQIATGDQALSRHVGRVLFMVYEHQAMHLETLLYMLLQSPFTRAPTVVAIPQWDDLARRWDEEGVNSPNKVLEITGRVIGIGHDDLEAKDKEFPTEKGWETHEFGWDNEHPLREVKVKSFKVDSLPISNMDYLTYLQETKIPLTTDSIPSSWIAVDGEDVPRIRTMYGPVKMDVGGRWPVMASKVEIDGYCRFKGGRLPIEGELRLLWENEEGPRTGDEDANIGFRHWHPVP
jgi:formylglycine-generating enzyme required for sulfatase activity